MWLSSVELTQRNVRQRRYLFRSQHGHADTAKRANAIQIVNEMRVLRQHATLRFVGPANVGVVRLVNPESMCGMKAEPRIGRDAARVTQNERAARNIVLTRHDMAGRKSSRQSRTLVDHTAMRGAKGESRRRQESESEGQTQHRTVSRFT